MHTERKGRFSKAMQRRASERGRLMARVRWANDRARSAAMASKPAEFAPDTIVLRIVAIRNESQVKETVVRAWDSDREARRKIRLATQF